MITAVVNTTGFSPGIARRIGAETLRAVRAFMNTPEGQELLERKIAERKARISYIQNEA